MLSKVHKASDKARRFLQNKATLFVRNLTMTKNTSKVQALYDLCNTTFTPSPSGSSPPSSQALQRLCSLLGISHFLSFLLVSFSFVSKFTSLCALCKVWLNYGNGYCTLCQFFFFSFGVFIADLKNLILGVLLIGYYNLKLVLKSR